MPNPHYRDSGCTGSTPLVLGAARGHRSFYLDEGGWLRGVTYRWPWRDGENVAQCFVTVQTNPLKPVPGRYYNLYGATPPYYAGGVVFQADPDVPVAALEGHQLAGCDGIDADCGCGFYAYHDADMKYALSGPGCRVTGVVEAYGRLVLGPQGYRAQKARILGIVVPPVTEASRRRRLLERTIADLREAIEECGPRVWRSSATLVYATATIGALAAAVFASGGRAAALFAAGFTATNWLIGTRAMLAHHKTTMEALQDQLATSEAHLQGMPNDYSGYIELCRKNYPGVRFFHSEREMFEAFPVSSLRTLAIEHHKEADDAGT